MRAVFGLLLVIWTVGGMAVGTYQLINSFKPLLALYTPDQYPMIEQMLMLFGLPAIMLLLLWLGGVIMFAALLIASPSKRF